MSKTVLITGCHKGIGLGLVNQYLKEGFKVVATTRNLDEASDLKNCLKNAGEDPPISLDVTDDVSINDAAKVTRERVDKLDILINNAGITTKKHPEDKALEIVRKEMLQVYDTDVIGALNVTKAFYPLMENSDVKKVNFGETSSVAVSYSSPIFNGLHSSKPTVTRKIIRPTLFDLLVADPAVIPQDSGVTEGPDPRSLPKRKPFQDVHDPPEFPPPPLKPPPKDQEKSPPKPGGSTPYTDPPPMSVTKEGPKKDPPSKPDSGERSAARRPREKEIIEKGHRYFQEGESIRSRIKGKRFTFDEHREEKNPRTTPAGDTSTGPLVSIDPFRRPKRANGLVSFGKKKPTEDPTKPKGDIKGNPDKDGGYGGSKVRPGKGGGKETGKSAYSFYPGMGSKDQPGDGKNGPEAPLGETTPDSSRIEAPERSGYGGETPDWLPGEPAIPKADVEDECVVGEPPKPEDMVSSSPYSDDEFDDDLKSVCDDSCIVEHNISIHRHSMLGIRPDTGNLLDIFYEDLKKAVDKEALVITLEEEEQEEAEVLAPIVEEVFEATDVEATFEIVQASCENRTTGDSFTLKKPPPSSLYTGEEGTNIYKDQQHIPEVSPDFPSEVPAPEHPGEWQPVHEPDFPNRRNNGYITPADRTSKNARPMPGHLQDPAEPPRPSPRNDPTPQPAEDKRGPFPKEPVPDPGQFYPGRRGPTEPSPSPGDSNPLRNPGGPIMPPDPSPFMPNASKQSTNVNS